jgi:hypothetical protein
LLVVYFFKRVNSFYAKNDCLKSLKNIYFLKQLFKNKRQITVQIYILKIVIT